MAGAFSHTQPSGHIVAGVAGEEEVRAFREFCEGLGQVFGIAGRGARGDVAGWT